MNSHFSCERPVLFAETEEGNPEILVHNSQVLRVGGESLHRDGRLALLHLSHQKCRCLPFVNLNLVHVDGTNPGRYCHVLAFGTKNHACGNFIWLIELFKLS